MPLSNHWKNGDIVLNGLPCLLSKSNNNKRKTPFTVEAISLNKVDDKEKSWIGINQIAINKYVEFFLKNGAFESMVKSDGIVLREQFLGDSKLDFLIGATYLEAKTPLQSLQIDIPSHVKKKKVTPFKSTGRFTKHIHELAKSLETNNKAILLNCFMYDNPGFKVINKSENYEEVSSVVERSEELGVELWQANFEITHAGVALKKYFKLNAHNLV